MPNIDRRLTNPEWLPPLHLSPSLCSMHQKHRLTASTNVLCVPAAHKVQASASKQASKQELSSARTRAHAYVYVYIELYRTFALSLSLYAPKMEAKGGRRIWKMHISQDCRLQQCAYIQRRGHVLLLFSPNAYNSSLRDGCCDCKIVITTIGLLYLYTRVPRASVISGMIL